jgi:hypothetical protein
MDLSPPSLTRSPASPPNTYCPSETSSIEYPSPVLAHQQYKIASIYAGQSCSLPHSLEDNSLPPLDSMTPAGWHSPAIMAPTSTSSSIPNILSAEYDPFANYESPLSGPYGHEVYPPPPTHHGSVVASSPGSVADVASRSPAPSSRHSLTYPQPSLMTSSMASRVKMEAHGDYSPGVEVPHYPSPRSIPASYGTDAASYAGSHSSYVSDDQASAWPRSEYETDQFYHGSPSQTSPYIQDTRRQFRLTRPRRPARRLTTKEEANFQCEVKGCGKLFSRSYNFKAHMETHDEKREYPFPCSVSDCNKKFVRKTDLQRHHQSVHMKERNHKCDYCGRLFARKDTLRRYASHFHVNSLIHLKLY